MVFFLYFERDHEFLSYSKDGTHIYFFDDGLTDTH